MNAAIFSDATIFLVLVVVLVSSYFLPKSVTRYNTDGRFDSAPLTAWADIMVLFGVVITMAGCAALRAGRYVVALVCLIAFAAVCTVGLLAEANAKDVASLAECEKNKLHRKEKVSDYFGPDGSFKGLRNV